MQDCKIVTPVEIFSTREKLEKLLRINHKNQYTCKSLNDDDTTNNAV